MALSKRTQLYLAREQWATVEATARRLGVSSAEVVRRAIDMYCRQMPDFSSTAAKVAGAWKGRKGLPKSSDVRRFRQEWEKRPGG